MMRGMSKLASVVLLNLFFATVILISKKYHMRHTEFSCVSSYVQHDELSTMNILVNYVFKNKEGYISIDGSVLFNNGIRKGLSRKIFFTFSRDKNSFFIRSHKNMRFPTDNIDNSSLEKLLPLFFIYPEKDIFMRIQQEKNGQYIFFIDPISIYMCKKY